MANARPEVHVPITSAAGSAPPPATLDRFAPKYLVGNVPAGDSATPYSQDGFVYIPDPGDCTGIRSALGFGNGDVWLRPGLYELDGADTDRLTVPAGVRLWGSGANTIIQTDGFTDNCAVEVNASGEFGWCALFHDAEIAGAAGNGIVQLAGPGAYVHDLNITLGTLVTGLNGGIFITGTGSSLVSRVENVTIQLPLGAGGAVTTWIAGVYGDAVSPHVAQISNITVNGGDAAVVTRLVEMHIESLYANGQSTVPVYAITGFLTIGGSRSTIRITRNTVTAAIQLQAGAYEIGSVRFLNVSGGAAIPAILTTGVDINGTLMVHDCNIGSTFSPALNIDFMQDATIYSNQISAVPAAIPMAFGANTNNCIVFGNVSRGSGSVLPTDAGTGNSFANNIWGA